MVYTEADCHCNIPAITRFLQVNNVSPWICRYRQQNASTDGLCLDGTWQNHTRTLLNRVLRLSSAVMSASSWATVGHASHLSSTMDDTSLEARASGLNGAVSATVGIFLMPWLLAAAAAQQLQRFMQHLWLAGFGRGAAPAVVGLLGVTALSVAKQSFTHWAYALMAVIALGLALRTKLHPILSLVGDVGLAG